MVDSRESHERIVKGEKSQDCGDGSGIFMPMASDKKKFLFFLRMSRDDIFSSETKFSHGRKK